MISSPLSDRPLQIMAACRAYDLPVFEIAVRHIQINLRVKEICVVAPAQDCRTMQRRLGPGVRVVAEDEFLPGMNIGQLRLCSTYGFPKLAGWYFQQFLKLQFSYLDQQDDYYLIWDADTVPLRPMRFFDGEGRMLLTKATEYHEPYFAAYRRLFAAEPNREFSFIAQHMVVQKSLIREMLGRIEQNVPGDDNWAWKIMRSLPPTDCNQRFSEYETCGHYFKNYHPARVVFIERPWWRDFTSWKVPTDRDLVKLAAEHDFASFEKAAPGWRRLAKQLSKKIGLRA